MDKEVKKSLDSLEAVAMRIKYQRDQLAHVAKAVCEGFAEDPGTSDLDNEQPIHVCIPLGEYRRARLLLYELEHK